MAGTIKGLDRLGNQLSIYSEILNQWNMTDVKKKYIKFSVLLFLVKTRTESLFHTDTH